MTSVAIAPSCFDAPCTLACAETGDTLYDGFAADFGRRHASVHEYEHRRAIFHGNRQLIDAHNSAGHNFSLGINQYADWTEVCMLCHLTSETILMTLTVSAAKVGINEALVADLSSRFAQA